MAKWVGEETIEEVEVPVMLLLLLRQVTVEAANLRSPRGHHKWGGPVI